MFWVALGVGVCFGAMVGIFLSALLFSAQIDDAWWAGYSMGQADAAKDYEAVQ